MNSSNVAGRVAWQSTDQIERLEHPKIRGDIYGDARRITEIEVSDAANSDYGVHTEYREGLSAKEVDASLRAALERKHAAERTVLLWFCEMRRRKLYNKLGYVSMREYAREVLGLSDNMIYRYDRLDKLLEGLPATYDAIARGELGWTHVRELVKVASKDNEEFWIERARTTSRRTLERDVAELRDRQRQKANRRKHLSQRNLTETAVSAAGSAAGSAAVLAAAPAAASVLGLGTGSPHALAPGSAAGSAPGSARSSMPAPTAGSPQPASLPGISSHTTEIAKSGSADVEGSARVASGDGATSRPSDGGNGFLGGSAGDCTCAAHDAITEGEAASDWPQAEEKGLTESPSVAPSGLPPTATDIPVTISFRLSPLEIAEYESLLEALYKTGTIRPNAARATVLLQGMRALLETETQIHIPRNESAATVSLREMHRDQSPRTRTHGEIPGKLLPRSDSAGLELNALSTNDGRERTMSGRPSRQDDAGRAKQFPASVAGASERVDSRMAPTEAGDSTLEPYPPHPRTHDPHIHDPRTHDPHIHDPRTHDLDSDPSETGFLPRGKNGSPYKVVILWCESCGKAVVETNRGRKHLGRNELERVMCDTTIEDANGKARQSIRPSVRRKVLKRDHYRCQMPGCTKTHFLEIHHRRPRSQGGTDRPENLITLCSGCHQLVHQNGWDVNLLRRPDSGHNREKSPEPLPEH